MPRNDALGATRASAIVAARRRARRRGLVLLALVGPIARVPVRACDVCAIYTATELREEQIGPRVGLFEQFTNFDTLQQGGVEVANPYDEHLNSSITQFLFGYQFTRRLGAQVIVPYIARPFSRNTANGIQDGDVNGFGDLSLVGNWLAYDHVDERSVVLFTLLGALKLPSGNSDKLGEEAAEDDPSGPVCLPGFVCGLRSSPRPAFDEDVGVIAHHPGGDAPPSGIHGHDLALGSGSVDIILGGHLFASWDRLYTRQDLQYAIRREGSFDYQYANELVWNAALGTYLLLGHDYTLGVELDTLVETKGKDTLAGQPVGDTAITSIYLGPGLVFTWGSALGADLIFDFPTVQNNTGLQIVPTFRVRAGATWRF